MGRFTGLLGLVVILGVAYLVSNQRHAIRLRILLWGLGLQVLFAVIVLTVYFSLQGSPARRDEQPLNALPGARPVEREQPEKKPIAEAKPAEPEEELDFPLAKDEFVRFVGLQKGDTLKRLYASARMFVFASRVDTLGLVNMEAMSSGVPVLVPSDACIAEFVTARIRNMVCTGASILFLRAATKDRSIA